MRWLLAAGVAGCLLVSPDVRAQATWDVVVGIPADSHIRVSGPTSKRVTGRILKVDATGISLVNRHADLKRFRKEEVLLVEKLLGDPDERARGARKGFLWGSALAALGTYGTLMGGGGEKLAILYGVTMGGGTALGALTAKRTARWVVVYRKWK